MPPISFSWSLALLWFAVYWILGGVFFSLIAATRLLHLNKARFSCLFTFGSVVAAYAASAGALILAHPGRSVECTAAIVSKERGLGTLLTCNAPAVFASGGMCFALLVMGGLIAMLFSRIEKSK